MKTRAQLVSILVATGLILAILAPTTLAENPKNKDIRNLFNGDEAFAQIPQDQLNALLKDKQALTKVLTYHVVAGKVTAKDVAKLNSAKTVEGQSIAISTQGGVKVNDANVIKADIIASNGVIHVIDKVIMPN